MPNVPFIPLERGTVSAKAKVLMWQEAQEMEESNERMGSLNNNSPKTTSSSESMEGNEKAFLGLLSISFVKKFDEKTMKKAATTEKKKPIFMEQR